MNSKDGVCMVSYKTMFGSATSTLCTSLHQIIFVIGFGKSFPKGFL
jgi:hypothetical protein